LILNGKLMKNEKYKSIPFKAYNYPLIFRLWHVLNYIYFLSRMTKEERAEWDKEGLDFTDWAIEKYGKDIKNQ